LSPVTADDVRELARDCGFELAGVTPAVPVPELHYYRDWVARDFAGEMRYLTDRRAAVRDDPRNLLPSARSIICVGKLYNTPHASILEDPERAWISRYAWGGDYHDVLRRGLADLRDRLRERAGADFDSKICVDTVPLLERSYARQAGLGWIGRNTCLIHQGAGSWFFLGELLVSLDITSADAPPPDRCGTCRRCVDACPTAAIVPADSWRWTVDSRLCISYFTIELRGTVPEEQRGGIGPHVFGCDICQDVCPWNRRAPVTMEPAFQPEHLAPDLEKLAAMTEEEFRAAFRETPVSRARYSGFLRNVAIGMGNARLEKFREPLQKLVRCGEPLVEEHARWALAQLSPPAANIKE
jgi:epoxyqueuosine reductase